MAQWLVGISKKAYSKGFVEMFICAYFVGMVERNPTNFIEKSKDAE